MKSVEFAQVSFFFFDNAKGRQSRTGYVLFRKGAPSQTGPFRKQLLLRYILAITVALLQLQSRSGDKPL